MYLRNCLIETPVESKRLFYTSVSLLTSCRGMVQGGRRDEGSGWGTCVYLWQIHADIWQDQYNIVKLKNKIFKKLKKKETPLEMF